MVGWVLAPSTGRLPREGGSLEWAAPSRGRTYKQARRSGEADRENAELNNLSNRKTRTYYERVRSGGEMLSGGSAQGKPGRNTGGLVLPEEPILLLSSAS